MVINSKRVLAIIPARGGSKGIPRKNIALVDGKPLIYYTIKEALKSKYIDKLICSTDNAEIAEIAKSYGTEIPFLRPKELSGGEVLGIYVRRHAIKYFEDRGESFPIIAWLQPTSPLRTVDDIDESIKKLAENDADAVISVTPVGSVHPYRMSKLVDGKMIDFVKEPVDGMIKQKLPPLYIRGGGTYIAKRDTLMNNLTFKGKNCLPYIMPIERSISIDTPLDLKFAEFLIKELKNSKNHNN